MEKNHIKNIKVFFPKWLIILYSFCGMFTVFYFAIYMIWLINKGQIGAKIFSSIFYLVVILLGVWLFFKILFYSVIATDKGLVTNNLFGAGKSVLWDEIIEVRRPRFGIPADFTYVLLANKSKLLLVRSMKNYKALIQLIKEKAPNLQRCKF